MSKTVSKVLYLFAAQFAEYVVPLLMVPLMIAKCGIAKYGEVAYVQAIGYMIVVFVDYGVGLKTASMVAKYKRTATKSEILIGITIVRLISLCAIFVVFSAANNFFKFDEFRELPLEISFLVPLGVIIYPQWFFAATGLVRDYSAISILSRLFFLCVIAAMPAESGYAMILAVAYLSPLLLSGILSIILMGKSNVLIWRMPSFKKLKYIFYASFDSAMATIASSGGKISTQLIVGWFLVPSSYAVFVVVEKVVRLSQELVRPISLIAYPKLNRLYGFSKNACAKFAIKLLVIYIIFGVTVCLGLLILGGFVLNFLSHGEVPEKFFTIAYILPLFSIINMVIGYMTFVPFGMAKEFSKLILIATPIQLSIVIIFTYAKNLDGALTSVLLSEMILSVLLIYYHKKNRFLVCNL